MLFEKDNIPTPRAAVHIPTNVNHPHDVHPMATLSKPVDIKVYHNVYRGVFLYWSVHCTRRQQEVLLFKDSLVYMEVFYFLGVKPEKHAVELEALMDSCRYFPSP